MRVSEADVQAVIDSLSRVVIGQEAWPDVLLQLAKITGGQGGQLLGLGKDGLQFHWVGDTDPSWVPEAERLGGINEIVNPRLSFGRRVNTLKSFTDDEMFSRAEQRQHRFYTELLPQVPVPLICATKLLEEDDFMVALAVLRTKAQGDPTSEQRRVFDEVARHVRAAIRTQRALEDQGAHLIAGTLDSVSLTAFVCDRSGHVEAMTRPAEELIKSGDPIKIRDGKLRCGDRKEVASLEKAIKDACAWKAGASLEPQSVIVRNREGLPVVLDVISINQSAHALGFNARAIVVVRGRKARHSGTLEIVQAAYGLTRTEAAIALMLVDGYSPDDIAGARAASLSTVRTQVRSIHYKLGVRRQGELIARFAFLSQ